MPKDKVMIGLIGACLLAGCGASPGDSGETLSDEAPAGNRNVALPDDFPADIALPEDARLVLVSRPLPGDVFIEGRSAIGAKEIVEGFAQRLADAGYTLTDRATIQDPLELYFEGKSVEGGNIRVRDDGGERQFMLTYTEAGR
ncbi:MAG: hypothetical protein GC147_06165 [Porphyrobacter sp.]|nr:hypothetical protein [Porphyrobacter sp.]